MTIYRRSSMSWHCVYCGAWVEREGSAHCGEVGHTEEWDDGADMGPLQLTPLKRDLSDIKQHAQWCARSCGQHQRAVRTGFHLARLRFIRRWLA